VPGSNICSDLFPDSYSKLVRIIIADGSTNIVDAAFVGCNYLQSVSIPATVTTIGNNAFYGCTRIKNIVVPGGFKMSTLFPSYQTITNAVVADGATSIADHAFFYCSGLTSITIPDGVTSIGDYAFFYCSGLTSITIPDGVTSIGIRAFEGCSELTSITIPNSVTNIGNYAFSGCSKLMSISIPNSVTNIGDNAFARCSKLTSITIPDSVTSIGERAFYRCSGLPSITIPAGVTSIGDGAFYDCSGLTAITIPDSVKSIGSDAFKNCSSLATLDLPFHFLDRTDSMGIPDGCLVRFGAPVPDGGTVNESGMPLELFASWSASWRECEDTTRDDGLCLRSSEIPTNGISRLFAFVSGAGRLSFDWKISAARGDYCRFYADGVETNSIQRSTGWKSAEISLGPGQHLLEWVFERGTTSAAGLDAAFVDDLDWRPALSLAVSSSFGAPDPELGTHALVYGDSVAASVSEPADTNGIRRICTGWTGTGSVPASGTGTAVSFTITNDSSLVWNWRTDYHVDLTLSGPVAADFSDGWVSEGTTKVVNWTPSVPYFDVSVSGDASGATIDKAARTLSIPATGARELSLSVTERVIEFSTEGPVTTDFDEVWGEDTEALVVHWTPTVPYFTVALAGDTNGVALDKSSRTLTVPTTRSRTFSLVVEEITLKTALDAEMLSWTTDEAAPWFPQVGTSADGEDAAQASPVAGDGASGLETTLEGAGTLSWTWRLSSDDNTGVDVFLDGEWLEDYAPGTDWSEASLDVAGSGAHTVRFEFWNMGTTADATAWIDRVDWTGDAPFGGRLRLVSAAQTEAVLSTTAYTGGAPTPVSRILEIATDAAFSSIAKTIPLADVTERTVEEVAATGLLPETSYWARLRLAQGGAAWTSDAVPFATPAHVAPTLGTLSAEDLAWTSATVVVPVDALGSDGGAVELSLAVTKAVGGATVATLVRTVTAAGTERFELSGLEAETVYRLAATVRSVATGLETSATGGFTTAAHTPPALGTPVAEARTVGATISVPVTALGSDGGAVEVSVAATVANTGEAAGTAAPATLAAPGTAILDLEGLAPGTAYRFVVTARAVATGHETTVSGGFTTEWAETPRIAAGGSGSGERPALCFLPSESGDGEDFVIRIDNPVPGLWYPVYTNGTPSGPFAVQSCGMPESADGGYIVRVPAIESALFVKVGVSKTRLEPGTPEQGVSLEQAEWTTGTYSSFSPSAVSENLLRQSGAAYTGGNAHESEDGYRMDDPAAMTNGSIDSGMTLSDKQYRFAVESRQTLSWSFPSAATVREVRVYNIWGDSGRDRIDIESVDALVGGSWVPLAPDSVCCQDSSAGSYDDGKPGRPYAILAAPNGGAIATGATALRIVWGTAESGFVGVGEVEVIGSF